MTEIIKDTAWVVLLLFVNRTTGIFQNLKDCLQHESNLLISKDKITITEKCAVLL